MKSSLPVFRGSPSLPFIHRNELERLGIHRKRCPRTRAAKSLMRLVELTERTTNDTSLAEGEKGGVAPAQNPHLVERNDHRNVCVDRIQADGCGAVCVAPARVLDAEDFFSKKKKKRRPKN